MSKTRIEEIAESIRHLMLVGVDFGLALQTVQDQYDPTIGEIEQIICTLETILPCLTA